MPEAISLSVDGRAVTAEAGVTVAAALENAGLKILRRSVRGEARGVLCAMGVCFECRVTIDGIPHRRACMQLAHDGMSIETSPNPQLSTLNPQPLFEREALDCDVAVVGLGPAGVAAACRAAESGARTIVLDEGLAPGGQIYRHLPGSDIPPAARGWIDRLARSGAVVRDGAAVFEALREADAWRLCAETANGLCTVRARSLVLATGARELFLPFPGWTLPGVYGAGGAQALWKSGASMRGRTAVVAGSGPLLLPVAASLVKAGAKVALVAEQAGLVALASFAAGLLRVPGKLLEAARYRSGFAGTPYRTGTWVVEARGRDRLEGVVLARGGERISVACDLAAIAYGLTPNTELARTIGCQIRRGAVAVDGRQETTVPGVFSAGEPCGVAGVDVAIAEGEVAGLAAARRWPETAGQARRMEETRARGRRVAAKMEKAFQLRPELRALAQPETILCRCEDVPRERIGRCGSAREAKLATRVGMGPCQGRVCGPTLEFLFGWEPDTVRSPIKPVPLGDLMSLEEKA